MMMIEGEKAFYLFKRMMMINQIILACKSRFMTSELYAIEKTTSIY